MRTKTKKTSLALLATVCVATAVSAGVLGASTRQSVLAEGGVSATHVRTDAATGADWYGTYGNNGYVVVGNIGNKFYSSLYEGNNGLTEMTAENWNYNKTATVNATLKETSPVSEWQLTGTVWGQFDSAKDYKLYQPGTKTILSKARLHNGWNYNGQKNAWKDSGCYFTLQETKPVYLTVAFIDASQKISEEQPITVSVYNSETPKKTPLANVGELKIDGYTVNDGDEINCTDFMNRYYGGVNEALATTISKQTSYVTFCLEGAGNYQIVAYYNKATASEAPVTPMLCGFFFDEKAPVISVAADFVAKESYANDADWENLPYGKDGYIVANGANAQIYSDLYAVNASDPRPSVHSQDYLTLSGISGDGNNKTYVDGKVLADYSPIDEWAVCKASWGAWREDQSEKDQTLYKPGTTEYTKANIINGWVTFPANNISYIVHKKDSSVTYLTLYYLRQSGNDNTVTDIRVYNSKVNNPSEPEDINTGYGDALLMQKDVTGAKGYVTIKLEGKGYYQIVVSRDYDEATKSYVGGRPTAIGLFFDKENPVAEPSFTDATLSLDGTIGLNFYAAISSKYEASVQAKFVFADGSEESAIGVSKDNGEYKYTVRFAAKDYDEKVKAVLYSDEKTFDEKTFSVADYCAYVVENESKYDAKLVTLCEAIENLGARAKAYFSGVETSGEVAVSADVISASRASASGETSLLQAFALKLESGTDLRIYVDESVTVAVNGETALERHVDDNGNVYFEISGIVAKDLKNNYNIKFTAGESSVNLNVSAYSYVYEVLAAYQNDGSDKALALVVEAVYGYGEAAAAYFAE